MLIRTSKLYLLTSEFPSRPFWPLLIANSYIGGATQPGVTLQGTLMNHTVTIRSVNAQAELGQNLSYTGLPFILGETNSLYNQGKPGLSNAFGAALWGIDFNLYCASVGIQRVHMHMVSISKLVLTHRARVFSKSRLRSSALHAFDPGLTFIFRELIIATKAGNPSKQTSQPWGQSHLIMATSSLLP